MFVDASLGFIAYIMRDTLTGHMAEDWQDICDFSLGVSYGLGPMLIMFHLLSEEGPDSLGIPNLILRVFVSYVCSYVPFVAGAVAGFRFFPNEERAKASESAILQGQKQN